LVEKYFLDTNVIVDYILFKLALEQQKDKRGFIENFSKSEEFKKAHSRILNSYNSFELLLRKTNGYVFTSHLALAEVIKVILERYQLNKLTDEGISLKEWFILKENIKLSKEDRKELKMGIKNFQKLFIRKTKKIGLANDSNLEKILFYIVSRNIDTYDAFLVSQAKAKKIDYFVTNDRQLKPKLKGIIATLSSQQFHDKLMES